MQRREFINQASLGSLLVGGASQAFAAPSAAPESDGILLPTVACPTPLSEVVLFGFDDRAFPFQNHVETHLIPGKKPRVVLTHGGAGGYEQVLLYYGSVLRIGDTFHMWYNGNHGPLDNTIGFELRDCVLCYATSKDGINWEKPNLGLVEFNGSKQNNICDFPVPHLWSTAAVLHDPEDPDPNRRFKIAYEARYYDPPYNGKMVLSSAFSPDGRIGGLPPKIPRTIFWRWRASPNFAASTTSMASLTLPGMAA